MDICTRENRGYRKSEKRVGQTIKTIMIMSNKKLSLKKRTLQNFTKADKPLNMGTVQGGGGGHTDNCQYLTRRQDITCDNVTPGCLPSQFTCNQSFQCQGLFPPTERC